MKYLFHTPSEIKILCKYLIISQSQFLLINTPSTQIAILWNIENLIFHNSVTPSPLRTVSILMTPVKAEGEGEGEDVEEGRDCQSKQ